MKSNNKEEVYSLLFLFCSFSLFLVSSPSITAVSSIRECINDGSGEIFQPNGTACNKKLVVALTVQADEGMSQQIRADIRRVHDATVRQNVQLKRPVRITITKSPVFINYRLYGVGYVNNKPYERMTWKKKSRCRDDWFSNYDEAACGFKYDRRGHRIFDSQGFCCRCSTSDRRYDRGEVLSCRYGSNIGHCLEYDSLNNFVFGLYPPQLVFNITIAIDMVSYHTLSGEEVYQRLDTLILSPTRRIRSSSDKTIRAEYVADFHPSDYIQVLNHKYLLIPDTTGISSFPSDWISQAQSSGLLASIYNRSEWLLVGKENFGLSGYHCNKIGVSYSAFTHQTDGCTNVHGSCLQGQPYHYWKIDKERIRSGLKPLYMLHSFGKVHSASYNNSNVTDYQLNFIAQRRQRSLITLSMQADNLRLVINKSPARILEAFINAFEALSSTGLLQVYIQNIGILTATYEVSVSHCSSGIDWISSQVVTLDPGEQTNVSFAVHSFNALGQINNCEIQLLDQSAEVLDNLTIAFETRDTCFCYGYCGCSCGNNISECPPPPEFQDPDQFTPVNFNLDYDFEELNLEWLGDVTDWLSSHFGGLILFLVIAVLLILLGLAKVGLMIFAGQIACPAIKECCNGMSRCTSVCLAAFCQCFTKTALNAAWMAKLAAGDGKDKTRHVGQEDMVDRGAMRPVTCDGMCSGAKKARRIHRKKLRMLKRRGAKETKVTVWWEKPYTCTCVVKTTHDILEIIKGTFFFIYCPLLPLWWSLEVLFEWFIRRRRRQRRLQEYRLKKAEKEKKKEVTYLKVDDFSRGVKQKKVVDFDKEKEKNKKGLESGVEEAVSDDESAQELGLDTDTTDTDEAGDIEELLQPDYPVHFNYAGATEDTTPLSLIKPGNDFSIRGRLTQNGKNNYKFHLAEFTAQVKKQVNGKTVQLKKDNELNIKEFEKNLRGDVVQVLVTIKPLFTCLNHKPRRKQTKKKR